METPNIDKSIMTCIANAGSVEVNTHPLITKGTWNLIMFINVHPDDLEYTRETVAKLREFGEAHSE